MDIKKNAQEPELTEAERAEIGRFAKEMTRQILALAEKSDASIESITYALVYSMFDPLLVATLKQADRHGLGLSNTAARVALSDLVNSVVMAPSIQMANALREVGVPPMSAFDAVVNELNRVGAAVQSAVLSGGSQVERNLTHASARATVH